MHAADSIDVRILADDLTGALDSAVAFSSAQAGIGVTWRLDTDPGPRTAIDVATRERTEAEAIVVHKAFAPWLAAGSVSFKKIDSLLRGHVLAEIEACVAGAEYERVVIAPAFPFQRRITRAGRQWRLHSEEVVGPDLHAGLTGRFRVRTAKPGEAPPAHIVVYDAETDADLDRIVEAEAARAASILWIGSGGLAGALARHLGLPGHGGVRLVPPFVALVGTNHETTAEQIRHFAAGCLHSHIVIDQDVQEAKKRLVERMVREAPSLVSVEAFGDRQAVARHIDATFATLLNGLPRPGTLLVTGGETLRAVCNRLGAGELVVEAAIEPGLPVSRIKGGPFDGVVTISKSGAFGDVDLFSRLAAIPASELRPLRT